MKKFTTEIENMIESFLINAKPQQVASAKAIQDEVRGMVRKYIVRLKETIPYHYTYS